MKRYCANDLMALRILEQWFLTFLHILPLHQTILPDLLPIHLMELIY